MVREVSDQEIMDAKAQVGAGGLGCEPASAASVAGAKLLRAEGIIGPDERVVCILTGHQLKDPTATVAYHTTDQDKFNEVLGSRGVNGRPSPIGPWPFPTNWTKSSKPFSCTVSGWRYGSGSKRFSRHSGDCGCTGYWKRESITMACDTASPFMAPLDAWGNGSIALGSCRSRTCRSWPRSSAGPSQAG